MDYPSTAVLSFVLHTGQQWDNKIAKNKMKLMFLERDEMFLASLSPPSLALKNTPPSP